MAIRISDNPDDWRTDFTAAELTSRMHELKLPQPLIKIATGSAPPSLQYRCEKPFPNGIWPLQEDYIPIWTCNGSSAVGFEPSSGHFHNQHIEEIMDGATDVFASYRHLSAWLVRQLIEAGHPDEDVDEAAKFLEFSELRELKSADSLEGFMNLRKSR